MYIPKKVVYVRNSIQKNLLCRQESRVVCPLDLLYNTGRTKNIWRSVACNQGAVVWQKNSTIESRLLTVRAGTSQSRRVRSFDMTAFDRANWPPEGSKCQATPL